MSVITMTAFGRMGRFGNQIFQYMFLHTYAKMYGCEVQIPRWCGHQLWGHTDPPITRALPAYHERLNGEAKLMANQMPPEDDEAVDKNWFGYAQYHTSRYAPHKEFIRSLFQPTEYALERVGKAAETLKSLGTKRIGIHIRRGDYGRLKYHRTPIEWYIRLLHALWPTLHDPVLFIASQNPGLVDEFVQYDPVTAGELGVQPLGESQADYRDLPENIKRQHKSLDPFPEWYLLSQCDYILAPVSSYSFTAAMMNPDLKRFYRSNVGKQGFEQLDVWNTDSLLTGNICETYRHIPGMCLEHNPPHYWRCSECEGSRVNASGRTCKSCSGIGTVGKPPEEWAKKWQGIKEW